MLWKAKNLKVSKFVSSKISKSRLGRKKFLNFIWNYNHTTWKSYQQIIKKSYIVMKIKLIDIRNQSLKTFRKSNKDCYQKYKKWIFMYNLLKMLWLHQQVLQNMISKENSNKKPLGKHNDTKSKINSFIKQSDALHLEHSIL